MPYYIAVDIGGSKTNIVVFDKNYNVLNRVTTKGLGLSYETYEPLPELEKALKDASKGFEICSVAVNLGGKNKNQVYNCVKNCFADSVVSVSRESEGESAVAFGRMNGANGVLLAGTGTIAVAEDENAKRIISGGWGMNIGDGGSGYYIGLEAVKQSLEALDGCFELTPMQKKITGLENPISPDADCFEVCKLRDKVRANIFPADRPHIASFAKVVCDFCEKGEEDAIGIMNDAGRIMGELVAGCINKLLPYKVRKIAVSGGLVHSLKYWKDEFEKTVRFRSSANDFVYNADGLTEGTEYIAIQQYKES